jgi:phosphomethylpyrimidine synthase
VSAALAPKQQAILEQRGILDPDELHRLASKTRSAAGGDGGKAASHSDHAGTDQAKRVQLALPLTRG